MNADIEVRTLQADSDASLGEPDTARTAAEQNSLIVEHIADRRQFRMFRHYAFFGMAALIATLVAMLATWIITFGWRIFGSSARNYSSHVELLLAPLVVLASLVAVSMLPIVRLVFRQLGDKDDNKNSVTIWQTVISEIGDALKEYLGRSPKSPA
jgi:MFS family permease